MGKRTTPSIVAYTDEERLVGEAARNQALRNTANTVFDAKRLIGRKFSDPIVTEDMKGWPFKVIKGKDDRPMIEVDFQGVTRQFCPEEVSAMVLGKMKATAEAYLGQRVRDVVVTVPAYFNDAQRQATKDAGAIAGLNVLRILNEPTAAGLAYGLERRRGVNGATTILVFDFGGGTLDISILKIENERFDVLAVAGDSHLGGVDIDGVLTNYLAQEFKRKHRKDVTGNERAMSRLRKAAEEAKCILSSKSSYSTNVEIDALHDGQYFSTTLTRAKLDELCRPLFTKAIDLLKACLSDSGVGKDKIDEVVLVGGSTRIPKVQEMLTEFFDGKAPCKGINPDEAVAHGAAIQAALLTDAGGKALSNIFVHDVTPLPLGVSIKGDIFSVVVPKNTPIPAKLRSTYTTIEDNQTSVHFPIYEGERPVASKNHRLGALTFEGLLPAPMGTVDLECEFHVDNNGILTVEVTDTVQKGVQCLVIQRSQLKGEEIERMIQEAKTHEESDRKKVERAKAKNRLENKLADIKGLLRTLGLSSRKETKREALLSLNRTRKWLEQNDGQEVDASEFEQKHEELSEAASRLR